MKTKATTVEEYLASLPDDRRQAVNALRRVIKKNIDKNFKEGMQYGGIGYFLPHSKYPSGYHCDPNEPLPFAGIASQKNHIGLYLFFVYTSPKLETAFRNDWLKAKKKLDMGKSCVRFKKIEDVPLDVVGRAFAGVSKDEFVDFYEKSLTPSARRKLEAQKPKTKASKAASAKKAKKTVLRRKS